MKHSTTTIRVSTDGKSYIPENKEPTPEQWAKWLTHKSNKERWIEEQEQAEEL